jgi:RNA polymerase sigma-70 factor, ECF subfamily
MNLIEQLAILDKRQQTSGATRSGLEDHRDPSLRFGINSRGKSQSIMETEAAMSEAQTGFAERVRENQRRVFQIAYSVLGNPADAEEVAQEAFLSAYQNLRSLKDAEKFRGWVNRIAFRLALNRQRGTRRRMLRDTAYSTRAPEASDGAKDADARLLLEQLRRSIEKLPEKLRRVLQLAAVEEMDATQIGSTLGIPAGTVRSRLHAARKLLLEAMK